VDSPPLTYFEGEWSPEEKERLQAAVREVEADALSGVRHGPGAPWVLTSSRVGNTGVFVASRHGFAEVLTASSAGRLGEKISEFGRTQKPSSETALVG
jgi:RNase P/RNase MRP subunit POP5